MLEQAKLARKQVHLFTQSQILSLECLVLSFEFVLLVKSLVTAVLCVATVLERPSTLLQLGYCLSRKAGNLFVQLAHRITGQLLIGQLNLAASFEVGHDDVSARVLNIGILVGDGLMDRVQV